MKQLYNMINNLEIKLQKYHYDLLINIWLA